MPALAKGEKNLGRVPEQVVADGGFPSRQNILATAQGGVDSIGCLGDGSEFP